MLHLSQNIKLIRGLAGKTQPEFAKIIGEKLSNLKTYENTPTKPKLHVQKRIAEIANVSIKDLREKDLSEKDIKLKVGKDENVTTATETPQNGQKSGTHPTLTEIGELVKKIQYVTNLTIEQIADRIDFSRPHLTTLIKSGESKKVLDRLKTRFAAELAQAPELTTTTNKPVFDVKSKDTPDKDITIKNLSEVTKSQQDLLAEMSGKLITLVSKVIEKL